MYMCICICLCICTSKYKACKLPVHFEMHMLQQVDASAIPLAMITVTLVPGDANAIRSSNRVEAAQWSSEGTLSTYGDHPRGAFCTCQTSNGNIRTYFQ